MDRIDKNTNYVSCPICTNSFLCSAIDSHVNHCLDATTPVEDNCDEKCPKTLLPQNKSLCSSNNTKSQDVKLSQSDVVSSPTARQQIIMKDADSAENQGTKKRTAWSFIKSPVLANTDQTAKRMKLNPVNPAISIKTTGATHHNEKGHNSEIIGSNVKEPKNPSSQSATSNNIDSRPLAERMRPMSFDDYVGQEKSVGRNAALRKLLERNKLTSMIFWGPPGCGKTTLARLIANKCRSDTSTAWRFVPLSAATSGIADVKDSIKIAKNEATMFKRKTVLFVDEIHRFNKLQQDAFLPYVEDGTVVLVGATTENPSFHVNNALLSRCTVVVLEKLSINDVSLILRKAARKLEMRVIKDSNCSPSKKAETMHDESGLFEVDIVQPVDGTGVNSHLTITTTAIHCIATLCDGDARSALNTLQMAIDAKTSSSVSKETSQSSLVITEQDVKEAQGRAHILYDRAGDEHYDCVSALHKSIRGSDDSAALYWLARMMEGGEEPLFIARRLVVCASEDIGLADDRALSLAVSTFQACQLIGMPECAINLAHCVTYLARARKSNESYAALNRARDVIKNQQGPQPGVPLHLRNAPTKLMSDLGFGVGYQYNHTVKNVTQHYLPIELVGTNLFVEKK